MPKARSTPVLPIDGGELRPWRPADAGVLVQAWSDPLVAQWNPVPTDASLGTATRWIAGVQERAATRTSLDWVIDVPAKGGIVGEVGLSGFDAAHTGALIGYWLLPSGRGQGLATRAVRRVVEWAFSTNEVEIIVAKCHTSNTSSHGVAARSGFTHERNDSRGNQLWISRTRGR